MSKLRILPAETVQHVRETCLCLHAQRAARTLARRFDAALRPAGLNNGQFSLLMSLNRPQAARISDVATILAMDRTTVRALVKVLERRGLVAVTLDSGDGRSRYLTLTAEGADVLRAALPIWRAEHARIEKQLGDITADQARSALNALR